MSCCFWCLLVFVCGQPTYVPHIPTCNRVLPDTLYMRVLPILVLHCIDSIGTAVIQPHSPYPSTITHVYTPLKICALK